MAQKKQVKKTKKKISAKKAIAIGAGVAALGAGMYYFLGPDGKKNQKKATAWMLKMKKEAEKKITTIKNASTPAYHKIVDSLANKYSKQYKDHEKDIKAFAKHLKSEWKGVAKQVKSKPRKTTKKSVKKSATKK